MRRGALVAPDVEFGLAADEGLARGLDSNSPPVSIRSEPGLKDPPDGGHEGSAAGEEKPGRSSQAEPGLKEGGINGVFNRLKFGRDSRLELGARDGPFDVNAARASTWG